MEYREYRNTEGTQRRVENGREQRVQCSMWSTGKLGEHRGQRVQCTNCSTCYSIIHEKKSLKVVEHRSSKFIGVQSAYRKPFVCNGYWTGCAKRVGPSPALASAGLRQGEVVEVKIKQHGNTKPFLYLKFYKGPCTGNWIESQFPRMLSAS